MELLILNHKGQSLGNLKWLLERRGHHLTIIRSEFDGFPEKTPDGIVIMGGPQGVYEAETDPALALELPYLQAYLRQPGHGPVFGICLGCQMLAHLWGATNFKGKAGLSLGYHALQPVEEDALFGKELFEAKVFQYHSDTFSRPQGGRQLAKGQQYQNQVFKFKDNVYGVQFHPEVDWMILGNWCGEALRKGELPDRARVEKFWANAYSYMPTNIQWLGRFLDGLFPA